MTRQVIHHREGAEALHRLDPLKFQPLFALPCFGSPCVHQVRKIQRAAEGRALAAGTNVATRKPVFVSKGHQSGDKTAASELGPADTFGRLAQEVACGLATVKMHSG